MARKTHEHEMRVCIVVPMYNEAAVADRCIRTILPYIDALPNVTTLCVVDDGSRDATPALLAQFVGDRQGARLHIIRHETNRGYGAAIRTGAQFAINSGFDYALFMDSDLTNHPRYLTLFCEKMRAGWMYIKASRFVPGSAVVGVPWKHQLLSRIGNGVAGALYQLPIRDHTNGFRAVRTDLLRQMRLTEHGFAIIMEELCEAKRLGATFCEIPYTLTSRGEGDGRSHLSYGMQTWKQYFTHARNAARIPYRVPEHQTPV